MHSPSLKRCLGTWGGAPAAAVAVALLAAGDCNPETKVKDPVETDDNTCQFDEDCSPSESCVVGLCLRRCSVHDVCDPGQYCSPNGFCELGCRSKSECAEGKLCALGACVTGTGDCTTKHDCPEGLVCVSGECGDKPATCLSEQDCPGDQLCNGLTQTCFDPNPAGCNSALDCVGRTECSQNDCVCDPDSHSCARDLACAITTEFADCGVGGLCHEDTCVPLPGCSQQSDCDAYGLYCDLSDRLCRRTAECTNSAQCTSQAPATYCNTTVGRCEEPSCHNGAVTCSGVNSDCNAEGRCVPPAGAACTSHRDCCPDTGTSCTATEYCDLPVGATAGSCRAGCRTDADCNMSANQTCNAYHQCTSGSTTGSGGDGDPCEGQEDCRAGYFCGALSGVCYELCDDPDAEGQCPETGKTCTQIFFVTLCTDSFEPPTP